MKDIFGNENEINFENSHLVIFRDKDGKFSHFYWHEKHIVDVEAAVQKFNTLAKEDETYLSAEICTDERIREICAHWRQALLFRDEIERYRDAQKNICVALRILEDVTDNLNSIYDSNWGEIDG